MLVHHPLSGLLKDARTERGSDKEENDRTCTCLNIYINISYMCVNCMTYILCTLTV